MRRWLLPEAIEDALPGAAARIERLRHRLLELFRVSGYELVIPPLLEYIESLLTGTGRDLDLRTFKLVDQSSGRTLGIRADITPQVARIDAHLLNREGVARLCYCGSVLHTLPSDLMATREPLQLGAEIYGHAGLEADAEVLRLLARSLEAAGVEASRVDLGHLDVFRALARRAALDAESEEELFSALQSKDIPAVRDALAAVPDPLRSAILALPDLYGDASVLSQAARVLPEDPDIGRALAELGRLASELSDLPMSVDLADLRGYHYHSGVVFAAYCAGHPGAVALGGRYDQVGALFGRGRPATGFSLDLRELVRVAPPDGRESRILAPCAEDAELARTISELRERGEVVVVALPGHEGTWHETGCDRRLVAGEGGWRVEPIKGG